MTSYITNIEETPANRTGLFHDPVYLRSMGHSNSVCVVGSYTETAPTAVIGQFKSVANLYFGRPYLAPGVPSAYDKSTTYLSRGLNQGYFLNIEVLRSQFWGCSLNKGFGDKNQWNMLPSIVVLNTIIFASIFFSL